MVTRPNRTVPHSRRERGQSIIIIAAAFIGILAFIGLAVDFGILLLHMGHLKRGVDSAALAAAIQFRDGETTANDMTKLTNSANEFLRLNGVNLNNLSAQVRVCATDPLDTQLCTSTPRKLVRVTATGNVPFVFLPIIGIPSMSISASSVSEAASMRVILVIDISESMTYDSPLGNPRRDPANCNAFPNDPARNCQPFSAVKAAAKRLADWVLNKPAADEEDEVAIVIFSTGWDLGANATQVVAPGWTHDRAVAGAAIDTLTVYQPLNCDNPDFAGRPGLCRKYDGGGNFTGMVCPWSQRDDLGRDFSTCTSTNIGGGLNLAARHYANGMRRDALWITVLLTDGAANATMITPTDDLGAGPGLMPGALDLVKMAASLPIGFCPEPTNHNLPFCRDDFVWTRHTSADLDTYDADDYARNQADFLGCSPTSPAAACQGVRGQGSLVFTVGLGNQVLAHSGGDNIAVGESLLRYTAAVGDDMDPATDPCAGIAQGTSCGNYYFAASAGALNPIFDSIASRIFTKLAH
jgi:Flp pilus assembly protein TadG